jgi:hypothetical protein
VVEASSTVELLSTVTAGTLTASSPLAGLELFPTIFESNGDYLVASLHCEGGSDCGGTDTIVSFSAKPGC